MENKLDELIKRLEEVENKVKFLNAELLKRCGVSKNVRSPTNPYDASQTGTKNHEKK